MPTYQYQCDACGEPLEVVQSFSDDALTQCPSCNKPELRKVYGSVGVVFKGSGFYRTDSRTSDSKTAAATTSTTSTATPAKSDQSKSTPSTSTPSTSTSSTTPTPAKTSKPATPSS